MRTEPWKDGPGRMEFGETVLLKSIKREPHAPGISKEHMRTSFEVFGSHVEIFWNLEDDEFTWRSQRSLSDDQKRYLKFLTMLLTYTTFKDLHPEV